MATPTGMGYEIARATGQCAASGRAIAVGEEYIAALVENEAEERLDRVDYSLDAWAGGARPERLFGYWRTRMEPPEGRKKPFIDDESLMDLFEQLEGAAAGPRVSFRYLLALLLVRKRLLRYEGSGRTEDGGVVMRVRAATPAGAAPAPVVEVHDPGMTEAAIAEALEQLGAVMAGGAS